MQEVTQTHVSRCTSPGLLSSFMVLSELRVDPGLPLSEVRLEGQSEFCWLCEKPQRLIIPFEMRGQQRVYNLERKVYEAAIRGLRPVEAPCPVKFPLPDPQDPFSLKPGPLPCHSGESKASELVTSSSLSNAIAGARVAAAKFSEEIEGESGTEVETDTSMSTRTRGKTKG